MDYRIIDADSHVQEPADTWQPRVPAAMRDRAPRMVDLPGGRVGWSFDGGQRVRPVGMLAVAGMSPLDFDRKGVPRDRIRPGGWDPQARLKDMEYDMIQAQVLYPSVALTGAGDYTKDRDLQLACVRAYNDWLHEFCASAPGRLIGLPIAPMTGVEDLILEWRRVAERGARGIIVGSHPNGGFEPQPEDDRFWSEVQDWEYPVHIHFGFMGAGGAPRNLNNGVTYMTSSFLSRLGAKVFEPLADIVFGGLFERFPKLRIVAVETGIGWIPYYLDCLDDNFLRHRWHTGAHLKRLPSEYFREHIWATFITDPHGVENRHLFNVDHIMWSTDYPHSNSDWPNSQRTAAYELRNVPADEKRKIMRDNAARLYRLGLEPACG